MVGGVGAFVFDGVPEFVEFVFVIGTDVGLLGSESISMGTGDGAAGAG